MFKRILVALDFSDVSQFVVEKAGEFALTQNADIHLLHVDPIEKGDLGYTPPSEEISKSPGGEIFTLQEFKAQLEKIGIRVTLSHASGSPAKRIIEEATTQKSDLIILGSHGHSKIYHLIVGSVREEIAKVSRCAVLIFRKPAEGWENAEAA